MEAQSKEGGMPDAGVVTDAKGVIREANPRAAEMLGMPSSAMRGKLLIAFVARGDTRIFRQRLGNLGELARTGTPFRVLMRARGQLPFQANLIVQPGNEPASYRWVIRRAAESASDQTELQEVLGAVARLVRHAPPEMTDGAPDESLVRVGDCVARAIESVHAGAEERRVRFAVEGGDAPDRVRAVGRTVEESIAAVLRAAIAKAKAGAELRLRIGRHGGETVLEVQIDGVGAPSATSPLSIVLLAARLAADGGRLEVAKCDTRPLMRVHWPAAG
jgi:PAS domain S-box-containing protein